MQNKILFNSKKIGNVNRNRALKLTSLLYLKEALIKQEYEQCAHIIKQAKKFGANQAEIKKIISSYLCEFNGIRTVKLLRI